MTRDPANALAAARGILFDMDGVLVDSEPVHEKAIVALSAELGEPIRDHDLLFSFKGAPAFVMAVRLLELYPSSVLTPEQLIRRKEELYTALAGEVLPIPGAREFLGRSRAAGRRHGLATSASRANQQDIFRMFGLAPFFDATVTVENITRGKPDPEPYLLASRQLGLRPSDCLVIEDSLNGVKSGVAAGCGVIALTTTFPRRELERAGARFIVDSFSELP